MSYKNITPDDVLSFTRPTDTFLCQLAANTHGIEFLDFTISDYESKSVIFNVGRDNPPPMDMDIDLANIDENTFRSIKYEFSEDVLRLPAIQTSLVFAVGDREVPNFRMIERHYFRNSLVKSYDFKFGFCIPNSTNTWDAVYAVPPLDEDLIADMLAEPYETRSDSFYFVSGRLIMHNKASYKYIREDGDPQSKSYQVSRHSLNNGEVSDLLLTDSFFRLPCSGKENFGGVWRRRAAGSLRSGLSLSEVGGGRSAAALSSVIKVFGSSVGRPLSSLSEDLKAGAKGEKHRASTTCLVKVNLITLFHGGCFC
ncbi:unnamed protein product, partial [Phaeothamnion confervicola]